MEPLSDLLRSLHVSGSVYFCAAVATPWSKVFADEHRASFHAVRCGEFWLASGGSRTRLEQGDLLYVAAGVTHTLGSDAWRPGSCESSAARPSLLCGHCWLRAPAQHPVLQALPKMMLLRAADIQRHPWLHRTLELISREYLSQSPGSELVVDKLTEVLVVELIRTRLRDDEQLALARDRPIARSLRLLHEAPHEPWTIESLARCVALSRAAFARRFKACVGEGAFEYLTQLRMGRARDLLTGSTASMSRIAHEVGYGSDVAFSKAFQRRVGMTPAQYRRR